MLKRSKHAMLFAPVLVLAILALGASSASAAEPWWHINSGSAPANLPPESTGQIVVTAVNLGDADANGAVTPVRITDTLPHGLRATAIGAEAGSGTGEYYGVGSCSLKPVLSCEDKGVIAPYGSIKVVISVEVQPDAESGEVNQAGVSGGGALGASVERPVTVSEAETKFGIENYEMTPEGEDGAVDAQAGSHPFQLTTTLDLNQTLVPGEPPAQAKDLHFQLPPGLVGNPTPFPQCPATLFLRVNEAAESTDYCPADTVVGVAEATISFKLLGGSIIGGTRPFVVPLFNLTPQVGEPARFGFYYDNVPVYLDTSVRTGRDYGVTVSVDNITQTVDFTSSRVTFWGVPGAASHNSSRGWSCIDNEAFRGQYWPACAPLGVENPPPLLSLPTSCTGPLQTTVEADSWTQRDVFSSALPSEQLPALDGCNDLPFKPEIRVSPDVQEASKPSGLKVDVHVPQNVDLDSEGLSASDVKNITVALPPGVAINPSAGDGLEACSSDPGDLAAGTLGSQGDEIGYEGVNVFASEPGVSLPEFSQKLPGSLALASEALQPGVNFCANASKIGEVTIHTPLLPNPLTGFVYLAVQESNPFGSLIAQYIVVEDPVSGSLVKLPGEVQLCKAAGEVIDGDTCEALGQIISTFANNPQAPVRRRRTALLRWGTRTAG